LLIIEQLCDPLALVCAAHSSVVVRV